MATAVMIYDTPKLAEQLEHEAGFDASRAKSMARILAENTGGNLATREDILLTKGELKADIQDVRSEIQGVRGELQSVRSDLHAERKERAPGLVVMRVDPPMVAAIHHCPPPRFIRDIPVKGAAKA